MKKSYGCLGKFLKKSVNRRRATGAVINHNAPSKSSGGNQSGKRTTGASSPCSRKNVLTHRAKPLVAKTGKVNNVARLMEQ